MKKTTILALGDFASSGKPFTESFSRFLKYRKRLPDKFSRMEVEDYATLLAGIYPKVYTKDILIMTFFPYNFWNDYIEIYDNDSRVYGDKYFGRDFENFFDNIEARIKRYYKNHKLHFVNDLRNITIDRDKKKTKHIFSKHNIPTPKTFHVKNVREVKKILNSGENIFVKPRYGAMGKGVSYLSKKRWLTNFRFKNNRIISKHSDYGWTFTNITDNSAFIRQLIKRDFLFEQAVDTARIDNKKFDFRIYVVCGKTPYIYARSTKSKGIITNWTQGGKIENRKFLQQIPKDKIRLSKEYAIKAAGILGFDFTGVDVLMSRDYNDIYVLEVQSFPGYEKGFNLINFLIKHI